MMSVQANEVGGNLNDSQETLHTNLATGAPMAGSQEEVESLNSGAVTNNAGTTDPARTPRGEDPPLLAATSSAEHPTAGNTHYFASRDSGSPSRPETIFTDSSVSSPVHSGGASSSSLQSFGPAVSSSGGADSTELFSRLVKAQSRSGMNRSGTTGSASNSSTGPSRPTTQSRRFEGPHYPDQSFAALHRQAFTPPYPYLRAQSPFTSQSSHTSASPNNLSQEHLHLTNASRTEGNTPAESPGLFNVNATLRRGRVIPEEMETSQYKLPSLHPTYHMGTKESHSLRKDFDAMTGHKLINNYEVLRELGKGTHGKVKLARTLGTDEDDKVAIKIVKRFRQKRLKLGGRETQEDRVKKEIAVLKKARHHHVVSLLEVIDDPDADKVYMVLEYVEEGEMKWRRKADKWTVDFERHRIERERAAWLNNETIDADAFLNEVIAFNDNRDQRADDKRSILTLQRQKAHDLLSSPSRRSSMATILTDDEQRRELADPWSLEHGGDSESEVGHQDLPDRAPSSMSLIDAHTGTESLHDHVDFQPLNGVETGAVSRDPFGAGSAPMSPLLGHNVSHPSMSQLSDTTEDDRMFAAALKQVQRMDDASTFEPEDKPYRHVPCLSMSRCRECFRDTVLGLEYLHYQGIIHRDIKPANLLWDREHRVKISDFGVSYLGRSPRSSEKDDAEPGEQADDEVELARTVGTPAFYAPELCDPKHFADGKDSRKEIGAAMDVWALGVTLYCMIFARLPFNDLENNEMRLYTTIASDELFIPRMRPRAVRLRKTDGYEPKDRDEDALEYEEIGDELHDLLQRMLQKQPKDRITIPEIKRHPWVVMGMENLVDWLEKTDPAHYISDKKIHVTKEDVSAAMQPISVFERMRQGVKRLSSLVRGERPRGRDQKNNDRPRVNDKSIGAASRTSAGSGYDPGARRSSLRGDELAMTLRASRPDVEHPLSQSQVASPVHDVHESYFDSFSPAPVTGTPPPPSRPNPLPRGASTSESVMTIRATRSRGDIHWAGDSSFQGNTMPAVTTLPPGSGPNIYGRHYNQRPSHGLASKRSSASAYSATGSGTSSDNLSGSYDDTYASPSIGLSSAVATARVVPPSQLHESTSNSTTSHSQPVHRPIHQRQKSQPQASGRQRAVSTIIPSRPSAADNKLASEHSIERAQESTMRRENQDWLTRIHASESHNATGSRTIGECPPSPDDELWSPPPTNQAVHSRPRSRTSASIGRNNLHSLSAVSSSDDFPASATFSDDSRHPSMPSVISSVGSGSTDMSGRDFVEAMRQDEAKRIARLRTLSGPGKANDSLMSTGETVTLSLVGTRGIMETGEDGEEKRLQGLGPPGRVAGPDIATTGFNEAEDDGYSGDKDFNDDSDDEGIVFGGRHT